jgi:hypothetical protein
MARKVYLEVKVKVVLHIDDDLEVSKAMEEIDYSFNSGDGFDVLDTEMLDYEITDSK